jgi:hypothetical protein
MNGSIRLLTDTRMAAQRGPVRDFHMLRDISSNLTLNQRMHGAFCMRQLRTNLSGTSAVSGFRVLPGGHTRHAYALIYRHCMKNGARERSLTEASRLLDTKNRS